MKARREFSFTDSWQSRCGIASFGIPPIRELARGDVRNLVYALGKNNLQINMGKSAVKFYKGNSDYEATLSEYFVMTEAHSPDSYKLRGKQDSVKVEIGLKRYSDSHGIRGCMVIGGEVTVTAGIDGYVALETAGQLEAEKYFDPIIKAIEQWGETCRVPRVPSAMEKELARQVKHLIPKGREMPKIVELGRGKK